MLLHQITGFGNFSIFIRFEDLLMHLPDIMLRFRLRFISIRKDRKLTAKLFSCQSQPAVCTIIIEN